MRPVRPRPIARPQIVSEQHEWIGWSAVVILALAPLLWLAYQHAPWLRPARSSTPVSAPLVELQEAAEQLNDRRVRLLNDISQLELEVRIDRHASRLAIERITGLTAERDELRQRVDDLRTLLGANLGPDLVADLTITAIQERRFAFRLRFAEPYRYLLVSGGDLALWIHGRWQDAAADGQPPRDGEERIRLPIQNPLAPESRLEVEGEFDLPMGFQPDSVRVDLVPIFGRVGASEQRFDWEPRPDPAD